MQFVSWKIDDCLLLQIITKNWITIYKCMFFLGSCHEQKLYQKLINITLLYYKMLNIFFKAHELLKYEFFNRRIYCVKSGRSAKFYLKVSSSYDCFLLNAEFTAVLGKFMCSLFIFKVCSIYF